MRKFIIAAVATGAFLVSVGISPALAETDVQFNINLGGGYPGYYPEPYPVYPSYPVTDENYDDFDNADCGYEYITVKKWNCYYDRYRLVHKRVWVCN